MNRVDFEKAERLYRDQVRDLSKLTRSEYVEILDLAITRWETKVLKMSPWPESFHDGTKGPSPQEQGLKHLDSLKAERNLYVVRPSL